MKQLLKLFMVILSCLVCGKSTESFADVPNDWRRQLPQPILENKPEWVEMYYDAWKMADKKKMKHSGKYIFDTAFDRGRVWLWDTVWISHFGIYVQGANKDVLDPMFGHDLFYGVQKRDGAIPHVWSAKGKHEWDMHNPIFTLGELNYYRHTGDKSRLKRVLPILAKFYFNLKKRYAHPDKHIYRSFDWNNGMDNRPRGYFTIDSSTEQAMVARQIVTLANLIGDRKLTKKFQVEFEQISDAINKQLWCETDQFYIDLSKNFKKENHWSVASYWPLLAEIANKEQAEHLVRHLFDEKNFKTPFMVPTLGRKSKGYNSKGGNYWCGSVWIPTNTMVIKGLEKYGYKKEAYQVAVDGLEGIYKTWKKTGTFWENYDQEKVGRRGSNSKRDFVGWTGVQPIATLVENVIGIRTNAPEDKITWTLQHDGKHGIKNLKWGQGYKKEVDLVATPSDIEGEFTIQVDTNSPFTLRVIYGESVKVFPLDRAGTYKFRLKTN